MSFWILLGGTGSCLPFSSTAPVVLSYRTDVASPFLAIASYANSASGATFISVAIPSGPTVQFKWEQPAYSIFTDGWYIDTIFVGNATSAAQYDDSFETGAINNEMWTTINGASVQPYCGRTNTLAFTGTSTSAERSATIRPFTISSPVSDPSAPLFEDPLTSPPSSLKWSRIQGAVVTDICTSPSVLTFRASGPREATTVYIDTRTASTLSYSLRIGYCNTLEFGEDIVLEYYSSGTSTRWVQIDSQTQIGAVATRNRVITLPTTAKTSATQFRWRQSSSTGANLDTWGLYSVVIARVSNVYGVLNGNYIPPTYTFLQFDLFTGTSACALPDSLGSNAAIVVEVSTDRGVTYTQAVASDGLADRASKLLLDRSAISAQSSTLAWRRVTVPLGVPASDVLVRIRQAFPSGGSDVTSTNTFAIDNVYIGEQCLSACLNFGACLAASGICICDAPDYANVNTTCAPVDVPAITDLRLTFNDGALPSGWTLAGGTVRTPACGVVYDGAAVDLGGNNVPNVRYLTTPPLNTSLAYAFEFRLKYGGAPGCTVASTADQYALYLLASIDGGISWRALTDGVFLPSSSYLNPTQVSVPLTSIFANLPAVVFRLEQFESTPSDNSDMWTIDNVALVPADAPADLSVDFTASAALDESLFLFHPGGEIASFCGTPNTLLFGPTSTTHMRSLSTIDMDLSAFNTTGDASLEFSVKMGPLCSSSPLTAVSYLDDLHIEYSLDRGISWTTFYKVTAALITNTAEPRHITVVLLAENFSASTRFRISQPDATAYTNTNQYALYNLRIGQACPLYCSGVGKCQSPSITCTCDVGFTLDPGSGSCAPNAGLLPTSLRDTFDSFPLDVSRWRYDTGVQLVAQPCLPMADGPALFFDAQDRRSLATALLNTVEAVSLQFVLGRYCPDPTSASAQVPPAFHVEYSLDAGTTFTILATISLDRSDTSLPARYPFAIDLPTEARKPMVQFRFGQLGAVFANETWLLDNVLIGGVAPEFAANPASLDFNSFPNADLDIDSFPFAPNGVGGQAFCGNPTSDAVVFDGNFGVRQLTTRDLTVSGMTFLDQPVYDNFDEFSVGEVPVAPRWASVLGGSISSDGPCLDPMQAAPFSSHVLRFFTSTSPRQALTTPMDTRAASALVFLFQFAPGSGVDACDADTTTTSNIIVSFSVNDGLSSTTLATLTSTVVTTRIELPLPLAARTNATLFTWRQAQHLGVANADMWAIDDVSLEVQTTQESYLAVTMRQGGSCSATSEPLDEPAVSVEMSVDHGASWTLVNGDCVPSLLNRCVKVPLESTLYPSAFNTLRTLYVPLGDAAVSSATRFRLSQPANTELLTANAWAVESLLVGNPCPGACQGRGQCTSGGVCACNSDFTALSNTECGPVQASLPSQLIENFSSPTVRTDVWHAIVGGTSSLTGCGPIGDNEQFIMNSTARRYLETRDVLLSQTTGSNNQLRFSLAVGRASAWSNGLGTADECTDYASASASSNGQMRVQVWYSTDSGMLWTHLGTTQAAVAGAAGYRIDVAYSVSALNETVRFRILQPDTSGGTWSIDNFFLGPTPVVSSLSDNFDPLSPTTLLSYPNGDATAVYCSSSSQVMRFGGTRGVRQLITAPFVAVADTETRFDVTFDLDAPNAGPSSAQWSQVSGAQVVTSSSQCSPLFEGNYLLANGAQVPRLVVTRPIDTQNMPELAFYFRFGGGGNCNTASATSQNIRLRYSVNGGNTFAEIRTLDINDFPTTTLVRVPLTSAMQAPAVLFQWLQIQHSGAGTAEWAMDSVLVQRVQQGTVLQFDALLGGCANTSTGAQLSRDNDLVVSFSTDMGNSWAPFSTGCEIGLETCSEDFQLPSEVSAASFAAYPHTYRRFTLNLPEAAVSPSTLVRLAPRVPTALSSSNEWAIDNLFLGTSCVDACNGFGTCTLVGGIACACDANFALNSLGACSLLPTTYPPQSLRDSFDSNSAFSPSVWSHVDGATLTANGCGAAPIADTYQALFSGVSLRRAETVYVNSTAATALMFQLTTGPAAPASACTSTGIVAWRIITVLSTTNDGLTWSFVGNLSLPTETTTQATMALPPSSRQSYVKFRLEQIGFGEPTRDAWAMDNFLLRTDLPSPLSRVSVILPAEVNSPELLFSPGISYTSVSLPYTCDNTTVASGVGVFSGNGMRQLNTMDVSLVPSIILSSVLLAIVSSSPEIVTLSGGSYTSGTCSGIAGFRFSLMSSSREMTVRLDTTNVYSVRFKYAGGNFAGSACEALDSSETVTFMYRNMAGGSTTAYTSIRSYQNEQVDAGFVLSGNARGSSVEFRWYQNIFSCLNCDDWSISDITFNYAAPSIVPSANGSFIELNVAVGGNASECAQAFPLNSTRREDSALSVLVSADQGVSFASLYSEFPVPPSPGDTSLFWSPMVSQLDSSEVPQLSRVILPVPSQAPATGRLRIQQPANAAPMSIQSLYVGSDCPGFCNGHGSCLTGVCQCDAGYTLQSASCVPTAPLRSILRDDFASSPSAQSDAFIWSRISGGAAVQRHLPQYLYGFNGAYMDMSGDPSNRVLETIDFDATSAHFVQFYLSFGAFGNDSTAPTSRIVDLMYSTNGGVWWGAVASLGTTTQQGQLVTLDLPANARVSSLRLRLQQFGVPTSPLDVENSWAIDQFFVGEPSMTDLYDDYEMGLTTNQYEFWPGGERTVFCPDTVNTSALVFNSVAPSQQHIETIGVDLSATTSASRGVLQFELGMGCSRADAGEMQPLILTYSADQGRTWTEFGRETGAANQNNFYRRTYMMPAGVSSLRVRIAVPPSLTGFDSASAWALRNLYLGATCKELCASHGSCRADGVCECDVGFEADGNNGCQLVSPLSSQLKDEFLTFDTSTVFYPLIGDSGLSISGCGPLADNTQLAIFGPYLRRLETRDLDTTSATSVQLRAIPCTASTDLPPPMEILYSANGGINYVSLATIQLQPHAPATNVYVALPVGARSAATRIRFDFNITAVDPVTHRGVIISIDNLFVGQLDLLAEILNDNFVSQFRPEVSVFQPNGDIASDYCGSSEPAAVFAGTTGVRMFETTPAVVQSVFRVDQQRQVVLDADFTAGVPSSVFAVNSGTTIYNGNAGCALGTGNFLQFTGSSARVLETVKFDTRLWTTISFVIMAPASSFTDCETPDASSQEYLQFGYVIGSTFTVIATYGVTSQRTVTYSLVGRNPLAQSASVSFRWQQTAYSAAFIDSFAIDSIEAVAVFEVSTGVADPSVNAAGTTLQFDARVGSCASTNVAPSATAADAIVVEKSADLGITWTPVYSETGCDLEACQLYFDQSSPVLLPTQFSEWRRFTVPLVERFDEPLSSTLRFRVTQPYATGLTSANEFAMRNWYVGNSCPGYCNGLGRCTPSGVCVCDANAVQVNTTTCEYATARPTALAEDFNWANTSVAMQSTAISMDRLRGAVIVTDPQMVTYTCSATQLGAGGGYLLFDQAGERHVTTAAMDSRNAQFISMRIGNMSGCASEYVTHTYAPLLLLYSRDNGVSYSRHTLLDEVPQGFASVLSVPIASEARGPAVRFRIAQLRVDHANFSNAWTIDHLRVGGSLVPSTQFSLNTTSTATLVPTQLFSMTNGAVASSFCGSPAPNALVFSTATTGSDAQPELVTWPLDMSRPNAVLQFHYNLGCAQSSSVDLLVQYSTDMGRSWLPLGSECMTVSQQSLSICSSAQPDGALYERAHVRGGGSRWSRATIPLAKIAPVASSSSVMFRFTSLQRAGEFAIGTLFLGDCHHYCGGFGRCSVSGSCVCDQGYTLNNGTNICSRTLSTTSLESTFDTGTLLQNSGVWLTSDNATSIVTLASTRLDDNSVLSLADMLVTVDMDLRLATSVIFTARLGGERLLVQFSTDGGVTWTLLHQLSANEASYAKPIHVGLPQDARGRAVRLRLRSRSTSTAASAIHAESNDALPSLGSGAVAFLSEDHTSLTSCLPVSTTSCLSKIESRYTATLTPPRDGYYMFTVDSIGEASVYVDHVLVANKYWDGLVFVEQEPLPIWLAANTSVPLLLSYSNDKGPWRWSLRWRGPQMAANEALGLPHLVGDFDVPGVLATSYTNVNLQSPAASEVILSSPRLPGTTGAPTQLDLRVTDNFSVRMQSFLRPNATGWYVIGSIADDGVRIYLNERLIVEFWEPSNSETHVGETPVYLDTTQTYFMLFEYFEQTGGASFHFLVAGPFATAESAAIVSTNVTLFNSLSWEAPSDWFTVDSGASPRTVPWQIDNFYVGMEPQLVDGSAVLVSATIPGDMSKTTVLFESNMESALAASICANVAAQETLLVASAASLPNGYLLPVPRGITSEMLSPLPNGLFQAYLSVSCVAANPSTTTVSPQGTLRVAAQYSVDSGATWRDLIDDCDAAAGDCGPTSVTSATWSLPSSWSSHEWTGVRLVQFPLAISNATLVRVWQTSGPQVAVTWALQRLYVGSDCPSLCSGHGMCQPSGECLCDAGYALPACTVETGTLSTRSFRSTFDWPSRDSTLGAMAGFQLLTGGAVVSQNDTCALTSGQQVVFRYNDMLTHAVTPDLDTTLMSMMEFDIQLPTVSDAQCSVSLPPNTVGAISVASSLDGGQSWTTIESLSRSGHHSITLPLVARDRSVRFMWTLRPARVVFGSWHLDNVYLGDTSVLRRSMHDNLIASVESVDDSVWQFLAPTNTTDTTVACGVSRPGVDLVNALVSGFDGDVVPMVTLDVDASTGFALTESSTSYDTFSSSFIDSSKWALVQGASPSQVCGQEGVNGNALLFRVSGFLTRIARTTNIDLSSVNHVTFWLYLADGTGGPNCAEVDENKPVELQYSLDGGSSTLSLGTYRRSEFGGTNTISVALPAAARTASTQLIWSQAGVTDGTLDVWAIDSIRLWTSATVGTVPTATGFVQFNLFSRCPASVPVRDGELVAVVEMSTDRGVTWTATPTCVDASCDVAGNGAVAGVTSLASKRVLLPILFGAAEERVRVRVRLNDASGAQVEAARAESRAIVVGDFAFGAFSTCPDMCNGHGRCNGGCECDAGYSGSSCAVVSRALPTYLSVTGFGSISSLHFSDWSPGIAFGFLCSSSGVALFNGTQARFLDTVDMDLTSVTSVQFALRIGSTSGDLAAGVCVPPAAASDAWVGLFYSTNGGALWTKIEQLEASAYASFNLAQVVLPASARVKGVRLRWWQPRMDATTGQWGLSSISIGAVTSLTCGDGFCLGGENTISCPVDCPSGNTGSTCAHTVCQNGGSCFEDNMVIPLAERHTTCLCVEGFTGSQCQLSDGCLSSPCQNAGVCHVDELTGLFACFCASGLSGALCEQDLRSCDSNPCQNGGTCLPSHLAYTCQCSQNYVGDHCETPTDACLSNPCRNGGTCRSAGAVSFECRCQSPFFGWFCEIEGVRLTKTENLAILDSDTVYSTLNLPANKYITFLEVTVDLLYHTYMGDLTLTLYHGNQNSVLIENRGNAGDNMVTTVFSDRAGVPISSGIAPYTGNYRPETPLSVFDCQMTDSNIILGIHDNYNVDSGSLRRWWVDMRLADECLCPPGFTGAPGCTQIDACSTAPCSGDAVCIANGDSFTCLCPTGLTGAACDVDIDECASSPCAVASSTACTPLPASSGGGFMCTCIGGFTGVTCDTDIDECASSPCRNAGLCTTPSLSMYVCNCTDTGFTGNQCDVAIDECLSSPCQNGGVCTDGVLSFVCDCSATQYVGEVCADLFEPCLSSPCTSGATCVEVVHSAGFVSFTCTCPPRRSGTLCETFIPCVVGGIILSQADLVSELSNCEVVVGDVTISPPSSQGITSLAVLSTLRRVTGVFTLENTAHSNVATLDELANLEYVGGLVLRSNAALTSIEGLSGLTSINGNLTLETNGALSSLDGLDNVTEILGSLTLVSNGVLTSADALGRSLTTLTGDLYCTSNINMQSLDFVHQLTTIGGSVNIAFQLPITHLDSFSALQTVGGFFRVAFNSNLRDILGLSNITSIGGFLSIANNGATLTACPELVTSLLSTASVVSGTFTTPDGINVRAGIHEVQSPSPACVNGGLCVQAPEQFTFSCACQAGTTGADCSLLSDACASNPCEHGSTCVSFADTSSGYTCECATGFQGVHCDDCVAGRYGESCLNTCSAFCVNQACDDGVEGSGACDSCSVGRYGASCLRCGTCLNGECDEGALGTGACLCSPGFTGTFCEISLAVCFTTPCANGATCVDNGSTSVYTCTCPSGYTGDTCDEDIDECTEGLPCLSNVNVCNNLNGTYMCSCATGFFGHPTMEGPQTSCTQCTCSSVGTLPSICDNIGGTCNCRVGYTGATCATLEDGFCAPLTIPQLTNSTLSGTGCTRGRLNDTCVHECTAGSVRLSGDGVSQCLSTGAWSSATGTCLPECPALAAPANGVGTCPATTIDSVECAQSCNVGTARSGSLVNRVCLNGVWEGEEVVCTPIDECASSPCANAGVCSDGIGSFTCDCTGTSFVGTLCDVEPASPCASAPCLNGGVCQTSTTSAYTCDCSATGHVGSNCETDVDECVSSPCRNGGTCSDSVFSFSCACDGTGFGGVACETALDECASSPCHNGATCVDGTAAYTCTCASGFTDALCTVNIDECASSPCENGATCTDAVDGFACACASGYEGGLCATDTNECASMPCQNGGTCVDSVNGYSCTCASGYTDGLCTVNIDECASSPCANAGVCSDGIGSFTCDCTGTSFVGTLCDVEPTSPCASAPCLNGGACQAPSAATYTCDCSATGHVGSNCETDVDECASTPCQNGGTCSDGVFSFSCACDGTGFGGVACETALDECASSPCHNGATCVDGTAAYTCTCASGFTDALCTVNIDECASSPCQNGGTCTDGINQFACACASGYEGSVCATETDECASMPCHNGGTCTDQLAGYTCACLSDTTGAACETDIAFCASSPCQGGATCVERAGAVGYDCTCTAQRTGTHCDSFIDACASDPCQNFGTCTSVQGVHSCTCLATYTGDVCETGMDDTECVTAYADGTIDVTIDGGETGPCALLQVQLEVKLGSVTSPTIFQVFTVAAGDPSLSTDPSGIERRASGYVRVEPSGATFSLPYVLFRIGITTTLSADEWSRVQIYASSGSGPFEAIEMVRVNATAGYVIGQLRHLSVMAAYVNAPVTGSGSSSGSTTIIIGAAAAVVCLLIVLVAILLVLRHRRVRRKSLGRSELIRQQSHSQSVLTRDSSRARNESLEMDELNADQTINPLVFGRHRASIRPVGADGVMLEDANEDEPTVVSGRGAGRPYSALTLAGVPMGESNDAASSIGYVEPAPGKAGGTYVTLEEEEEEQAPPKGPRPQTFSVPAVPASELYNAPGIQASEIYLDLINDNDDYKDIGDDYEGDTGTLFSSDYRQHEYGNPEVQNYLVVKTEEVEQQRHKGIFEALPKMDEMDGLGGYDDDDDREDLDNCLPGKQFDRGRLTFEMEVGKGNFGFVLKASHRDTRGVLSYCAVKTLNENASKKDQEDFVAEANLLASFSHVNTLSLTGVCMDREPWLIVSAFAEYGDVRTFMRRVRKASFDMKMAEKVAMALQIARGMHYLVGQGILHRDLAARNCLLFAGSNVKIADFGLAVRVEGTEMEEGFRVPKGTQLPVRWMAMEVLSSGRHFRESEAWSYAICVWEILSYGMVRPYSGVPTSGLLTLFSNGDRLQRPKGVPDDLWEILMSCWAADRLQRPIFQDIVMQLAEICGRDQQRQLRDVGAALAEAVGSGNDESVS